MFKSGDVSTIFSVYGDGAVMSINNTTKEVIFPGNFKPILNRPYTNLIFKKSFKGKQPVTNAEGKREIFKKVTAYHPDYDTKGNKMSKVADFDSPNRYATSNRRSFTNIKGIDSLVRIKSELKSIAPEKCYESLKPKGLTIKKGTIIVKPVEVFMNNAWKIKDFPFSPSKKSSKSVMFKAVLGNFMATTFVAAPISIKGITCVCDDEIPSDTIAMRVVNFVAKDKSAIAFVKPVRGSDSDLYKYYSVNTEFICKQLETTLK